MHIYNIQSNLPKEIFGKVMHSISDYWKHEDKGMEIKINFLGFKEMDLLYLMGHHEKQNLCNKQQRSVNIKHCQKNTENANNISSSAIPLKQNTPKDIHIIPNIGNNTNTNQIINNTDSKNCFLSSPLPFPTPLIKIPLKLAILLVHPPHSLLKKQQFMISIRPSLINELPMSYGNVEEIKQILRDFFKKENFISSQIFVWIGSEKEKRLEGVAFRNIFQIEENGKAIISENQEFYNKCKIIRLKRKNLFKDLKNQRKSREYTNQKSQQSGQINNIIKINNNQGSLELKKPQTNYQLQTQTKSTSQASQQPYCQLKFTPKFSIKNLELQLQVGLDLSLASQPSSPKYETPPQTPPKPKAQPQYVYQTPKKKSTKQILEQEKQWQDQQQSKDLQKIKARVQFIKQKFDQKLKIMNESDIYFQQDKIRKGRQTDNRELGDKNQRYNQNQNQNYNENENENQDENDNCRKNQESFKKSSKKFYKIKSLKIRPQLQQMPKPEQQFFQQQQQKQQYNIYQKQQNGLSIIYQHEQQSQSLNLQKEQPGQGLSQSRSSRRRKKRKQSEFQDGFSIYQEQNKDEQQEKYEKTQNLITFNKQYCQQAKQIIQNQKIQLSFPKPSCHKKTLKYHKFPISDEDSASNQDSSLYQQQSLSSFPSYPISTPSAFPSNLIISNKDGYIIWLNNTQTSTQNASTKVDNRPQYDLQLTKNCIKISEQLAKQEAIVCFYCLPSAVEKYRLKCEKKSQMRRRMGIENRQKGKQKNNFNSEDYEHQIKKKIERKLKKCVNKFNEKQCQEQSDFERKRKGQMFRFVKYAQIKMKEGNQILSNQNSGKIMHYWYLHIKFS